MTKLPYKAGERYSGRLPVRLQETYEYHAAQPGLMSPNPEISMSRVTLELILAEYARNLETIAEAREAFADWKREYDEWREREGSEDPPPTPPRTVELHVQPGEVVNACKKIVDMTQNERRLQNSNAVPLEKWYPFLAAMGDIVADALDPEDPETERRLSDISRRWLREALDREIPFPDHQNSGTSTSSA